MQQAEQAHQIPRMFQPVYQSIEREKTAGLCSMQSDWMDVEGKKVEE